ncbi:hypothetical protein PYW08_007082 [Mythimna loreyi]|uniref:Uncharacterized protein n=1 Tax=Mythimna loreyi TaxID=667449 RepID=A0ACC2RB39_9NEOP|nr:hypothetical protein PYW08_007082 [Mythimna loreyi]
MLKQMLTVKIQQNKNKEARSVKIAAKNLLIIEKNWGRKAIYYKMCSPCGPMVCYKYEDCGPPLQCLPRSAFKRNGLQDCQFFQQGSIRYLCRADCCCPRPCPPCCPPIPRGKPTNGGPRLEEDGENKKSEKENQLKRTKSRELRGGIMYYSCHCIKRNGLQHDCRRTGCGGEPACLVLPDPLCAPSQLARARGLADPAALAAHMHAQAGGSSGGPALSGSGGKRFIVCELKGIVPDAGADKSNKCCKCPTTSAVPTQAFSSGGAKPPTVVPTQVSGGGSTKPTCLCTRCGGGVASVKTAPDPPPSSRAGFPCSCNCRSGSGVQTMQSKVIAFDENTMNQIMKRFDKKEMASRENKIAGPGGRIRDPTKTSVPKEEPCTRPGCVHWQPPPPCVWDLPCKADCFEAPAGIQPGRNPLSGGSGSSGTRGPAGRHVQSQGTQGTREIMKLLTPEYCTGCSAPREGGGMASGGPAAGLPMLVMKLC